MTNATFRGKRANALDSGRFSGTDSMVKAVVFDLYETLVTQSGTAVPRAGALGESLGLDATAYRREWKQTRPQVLRGELTFAEALTQIGTRLNAPIPIERVQHARDERIRANTEVFQKIDPDVTCADARSACAGRASGDDQQLHG